MFQPPDRKRVAGFTLIEVLVALAVVTASLAAIGALAAVSMRGTRAMEQRIAFRETLRGVMSTMPDKRDFNLGSTSGDVAGYRWRLDVSPFPAGFVDPQMSPPWEPAAVVIRMQSPSGQLLEVDTIRLRRRPRQ